MPVQEARNEARPDEDADGIAALKRRAIAEVKDILRHADETCRACRAAGTAQRPPESPEPRQPG